MWLEEQSYSDSAETVREGIPVLERHGDDLGLARAWFLVGLFSFWDGTSGDEAFDRGLVYARRAHSGRDEAQILTWLLISSWFGPTPASTALARCRNVLEETSSRQVEAIARVEQGALLALSGRFDEARRSSQEGVAMLRELGLQILAAGMSQERCDIELLARDLPAAEAVLREACNALQELGEKGFLSLRAALLGLCLALQDRPDDAEPFLQLALEAWQDWSTRSCVHRARAATLLSQGSLGEAEDHARQAVAEIADRDNPNYKGDALAQLADVLRAAGKHDEAILVYSEALALYEQKENLVAAERVSRTIASVRAGTAT